jgi:phosphoglucomutase
MGNKLDKLEWLASKSELNLMAYEDDDGNIIKVVGGEDTPLTSEEQTTVDTGYASYSSEYDAAEYARNRADAYPSIQDQLDMQYWDSVNGTTTWKDAIQAVKDANPKPSE